ncbi:MAG: deoxyribose-phosphate aldolase [Bacteroidales bacterium]|jgi:deoxyribose-phosphate aldolase|nr:deoxyribose-phosphate aldolase [Bacteroidales bacterium]
MAELFKKYGYAPDKEAIDANLQTLSSKLEEIASKEVFLTCFSAMDLTTLKTNDTCEGVEKLVNKVNAFKKAYPSYPLPASVCVYSNFAKVVSTTRQTPELHTTCVSACFPSSQSFLPVKLLECEMAVKDGADEIDIVLPLSKFLAGKYDAVREELRAVRKTVDEAGAGRKITLKVILETGLLTPEQIAEASFISMEEGADFIKTSTGKIEVNATPAAAYVMCECIKAFNKATGKKVGFKPAGGVSTAMEAVCYYSIVKAILGDEWLNKDLFRLGVSRLANNLLSAIEGKTIVAF